MLDGFSTLTDAFAAAVPRHPQPRFTEKPQKPCMKWLLEKWQSRATNRRGNIVANGTSPSPSILLLQPVNASTLTDPLSLQPTHSQYPHPRNSTEHTHSPEETYTIVRLSSAIHINHNLTPAVVLTILLLLLVCGHLLYSLRTRRSRRAETEKAASDEKNVLSTSLV